jgi:hypothetical protein
MRPIACDSPGFNNQLQKFIVLQIAGVTVTHVSLNELSAIHTEPVSYGLNHFYS